MRVKQSEALIFITVVTLGPTRCLDSIKYIWIWLCLVSSENKQRIKVYFLVVSYVELIERKQYKSICSYLLAFLKFDYSE